MNNSIFLSSDLSEMMLGAGFGIYWWTETGAAASSATA